MEVDAAVGPAADHAVDPAVGPAGPPACKVCPAVDPADDPAVGNAFGSCMEVDHAVDTAGHPAVGAATGPAVDDAVGPAWKLPPQLVLWLPLLLVPQLMLHDHLSYCRTLANATEK